MDDSTLRLDQASARQLLLVRAIDEVDTQGKVLSSIERDQLEREALEASRRSAPTQALDRRLYLQQRTRKMLDAVENRHPRLAALQDPEPWRRWLVWLLPAFACLLGAALDRIDSPQRVNMLSPALLGVLFWNLGTYLVLLVCALLPARVRPGTGLLPRWLAGVPAGGGRRTGRLRTDIQTRLQQLWFQAAGRQQLLWCKQVLHLTAAGWAIGLALSIVVGGLVREYRVGWESTLLELHHVHGFLRLLFAPVVALLPFEAFSAADLQRMAFGSDARIGVAEARRWVWMYLALLLLLVVLPRLVLAAGAAARRQVLARGMRIDLRDPYFADVLARVSPTRVTLAVLALAPGSRELLLRVLQQAADRSPAGKSASPWPVLTTDKGDVLCVFEIPAGLEPPEPVATPAVGKAAAGEAWLQDLVARWRSPRARRQPVPGVHGQLAEADLVLLSPQTPGQLREVKPLLHWIAQPALLLVPQEEGDAQALQAWRQQVQDLGLAAEVLPLRGVLAHWLREQRLLQALGERLVPSKRAGFSRLAQAWADRSEARFAAAMHLLAALLVGAARDAEPSATQPAGLRHWVRPEEREAGQRAREQASQMLLQRLQERQVETFLELLRLHRLGSQLAPVPAAQVEQDRFLVQQAVDSPQAGMAGAASGAAMGAGIDLMTGGLTLGAAAALGAVIGGGAAFVAAAWRNRGAPDGQGQVQLGDDMLSTLTENALLSYLAVAHRLQHLDDGGGTAPASWRSEVIAAVAGRRPQLAALWAQARQGCDEHALRQQLADELAGVARSVLDRL